MPSLADLSRAGVGRPQSPPSHLATLSRAALNAVPVAGAVAPSVEEVLNLRNVDWARWAKEGLPAQILNAAVSGLTLPRDVATGAVDYNTDPDQVIGRAAELAGVLELGGMPFAKRGALGMAGGKLRDSTDIPMDEASRMARAEEMGFDVDAYKGSTPRDWRTGDEIDSFRATGLDEDVKDAFRGYVGADGGYAGFFSDDPNVANRFAEAFDPSGAVYPVKLKFNNPLVFDATNQRSRNFQFTEHAAREGLDIEHREIKRVLDGDSDHDGVILQNTEDEGTVYIPAGSHQVRSRFAKFDPAKKDSSNLLAGITGAGLGAGALSALADYDTPR